MTPDIQRAALRAAAKLALSAAVPAVLFACSGTTREETGAATSSQDLKASCEHTVDLYCNAVHPYETKEACCTAEVNDADFPSPLQWRSDPDPRVDPLTQGCCLVLATATKGFNFPHRMECCDAIGWSAAGACTPWGPPVPPAMKRRARLVA
jgi:hypothetical protein